MSQTSIMTIGEMIDIAFGDPHFGKIDFKLIETILHLLARQLRLLDRQVVIELESPHLSDTSSSIVVSEIKLKTLSDRKKIKIKKERLEDDKAKGSEYRGRKYTSDYKRSKDSSGKTKDRSKHISGQEGSKGSRYQHEKSIREELYDDDHHDNIGKGRRFSNVVHEGRVTKPRSGKLSTIESLTESENEADKKRKTSSKLQDEAEWASTGNKSKEHFLQDDVASDKSSWGRQSSLTSIPSDTSQQKQKYYKMLEKIEEERERVLRVIQQGASSREERSQYPSPMASIGSAEMEYEKLLVVHRLSEDESATHVTRPLSIVTQEQFNKLLQTVLELQQRYGVVDLPENSLLLEEMRKGASLCDAMAALQISARLDAVERGMEKILSLVTDVIKESPQTGSPRGKRKDRRKSRDRSSIEQTTDELKTYVEASSSTTKAMISEIVDQGKTVEGVTQEQMEEELAKQFKELMQPFTAILAQTSADADMAIKQAKQLEKKLGNILNMSDKFEALEKSVAKYAEKVSAIDVGLSAQVSNLLEQIQSMQYDLESGLESLSEALTHQGVDPELFTNLYANFQNLKNEIDKSIIEQRQLGEAEDELRIELDQLRVEHEKLRDTKCDRDEFADALRDKVGIKDINQLVSKVEHRSVIDDFKKRISKTYSMINNHEDAWQSILDDLLRKLHDKANLSDFNLLSAEISGHLNKLKSKIEFMENILGEPLSAAVTRKINRDTACISCNNPAHIVPPKRTVPLLPTLRPQPIGAEKSKLNGDGEHEMCIPGLKILHRIDPRVDICTRYCGGEHTKMQVLSKLKPSIKVERLTKMEGVSGAGTDGKMYKLEDGGTQQPCTPCNMYRIYGPASAEPLEGEPSVGIAIDTVEGAKANNESSYLHLIDSLEVHTSRLLQASASTVPFGPSAHAS